jgi:hypothetical protein
VKNLLHLLDFSISCYESIIFDEFKYINMKIDMSYGVNGVNGNLGVPCELLGLGGPGTWGSYHL